MGFGAAWNFPLTVNTNMIWRTTLRQGAEASTAVQLAASALCDKRNSLAGAERYRGGDAPAVVDGLAPRFIVAVGCIPGSLLASFPSFLHVIRIGFEKALHLQHLQRAVDFNPIMTRAAV